MIRRIHPHGPAVGEYVPGAETDIRVTFARERARLAAQRPAPDDGAQPVEIDTLGPDDLSPGFGAMLRAMAADEARDLARARGDVVFA
jgi:hypothetical protein